MSIHSMRTKFGTGLKVVLFIFAIIFIISAFWQFGPSVTGYNRRKGENKIIAVVNGDKIPMSAFEAKWQSVREKASEQGIRSPLVFADIRASIIVDLIRGQQLMQVAKEMGIDVSEKKVQEEIDNLVVEGLKANRRQVLGEVSRKQEDIDPRKDPKYRNALASVGSTVKVQEELIRSRIPAEEIQSQLVQSGIMEKIKAETSNVSEQAVKDSYKVYVIRYILLQKGKVSDQQLLTKAQNIVKEARAGKDFVKLAAANSDLADKAHGNLSEYSFDTRYMFPPEVGQSVKMLKPGQISDPLSSDFGYFIVQLVEIKDKTPAKLDKKTLDARKKAIAEDLQTQKLMEIQKAIQKKKDIKVLDPELNGYWLISEAMTNAASPDEAKKLLREACISFENALKSTTIQPANSDIIRAKLAQVLAELGETDKAIGILSQMIEGENATVVSPDLSKLLGDLFVKAGKKDRALAMYKDASDMARHDIDLRRSLVDSYIKMGRKDLADKELQIIAEKEKELKIWEQKNKGAQVPMPSKAPTNVPQPRP